MISHSKSSALLNLKRLLCITTGCPSAALVVFRQSSGSSEWAALPLHHGSVSMNCVCGFSTVLALSSVWITPVLSMNCNYWASKHCLSHRRLSSHTIRRAQRTQLEVTLQMFSSQKSVPEGHFCRPRKRHRGIAPLCVANAGLDLSSPVLRQVFQEFAVALGHAVPLSPPRRSFPTPEALAHRQSAVALVHAGPLSPPRRSLLAIGRNLNFLGGLLLHSITRDQHHRIDSLFPETGATPPLARRSTVALVHAGPTSPPRPSLPEVHVHLQFARRTRSRGTSVTASSVSRSCRPSPSENLETPSTPC